MFEHYSLREAGLVVQLGHDGLPCLHSRVRDGSIIIIDVSGFHFLSLAYCECGRVGSSDVVVQLLQLGWMPATVDRPRTAVTMAALRLFHKLNLQGKLNAYDFYHSLTALTDSTGLSTQPVSYIYFILCKSAHVRLQDRYKEFFHVVRWYHHLQMAKQSSRGHNHLGIDATASGEMVVECPFVPIQGKTCLRNGMISQRRISRHFICC